MTMAKTWETKNTATTVQMNRLVFMETSREKAPLKVRAGNGIRSRLVPIPGGSCELFRLHALQRESEPQHRGVEQPPGIVPQRSGIRELREQLEYSVDLCCRGFDDHPAVESAAALHVHRDMLKPPICAPPAIRNGHEVTSQVRSLFSSASRSEERRVGKECRSRWSPDH